MILRGHAGRFWPEDTEEHRNQLAGCFLWEIDTSEIVQRTHGPASMPIIGAKVTAEYWWVNPKPDWLGDQPLPSTLQANLFGYSDSDQKKIGNVVCLVDAPEVRIGDYVAEDLIMTPLDFTIIKLLLYDPDAVKDEFTISLGGRKMTVKQ